MVVGVVSRVFWLAVSSAPRSFKFPDSTSLKLLRPLARSHPVLSSFRRRLRAAATATVQAIKSVFREATRPVARVAGFAVDLAPSRMELLAENALLRQQLILAFRNVKRPAFRPRERGVLVMLSRLVRNWRDTALLVKPDTILRWHRQGYCLSWRCRSCKPSRPRPRLPADTGALVRRMASSNRLWGAGRIRGELLGPGICVANGRSGATCTRSDHRIHRAARGGTPSCATTRFRLAIYCTRTTSASVLSSRSSSSTSTPRR
jgi:hypothetical protein